MPALKIRIGATLDANLSDIVFAPLVAAAAKARGQIRKEMDGLGDDLKKISNKVGKGSPYRVNAPGGDDGGLDEAARKRRQGHQQIESEEDRHNREMASKLRQAAREAESAQRRSSERAVQRASGAVVSGVGAVVRKGVGFGADIARGAGVDFSLGNAVQQRFELEKRAIDLSNAGYMAGDKGEAGKRQAPRQLMNEAQEAANAAGLDANKAMEGLQAFVGKTGDLQTGRAVLRDLAVLSRATAAELEDVVSAAGDVSANLADTPDKAQKVVAVMRAIAGQGKVGAVEMKDLASQMAKLAASAPMFKGDVAQNMAALGALAQMARQGGGAASATQAATSIQGFVGTFGKKARRDAFKAAGVDIEDKKTGALLDPEEIIVNSLKKTGGARDKMNKLFMDSTAQRAVRGFQNLYVQSGGGAAGEKAVRERFAALRAASMGKGEVEDSFQASMGGAEAQTQVLKNQIQKQLGDAVERVAPQLMQLVPAAANVVQALGNLAGWAATNPFQAMAAALGVSLAKSLSEEMMRAVTARLISGTASQMAYGGLGGLQGASAAGTVARTAGAALAITAAAVTIASVGMLAIDKVMDEQKKGQNQLFGEEQTAFTAAANLRMAQRQAEREADKGGVSVETAARVEAAKRVAQEAQARLAQRVDEGKQVQKGEGTGFVAASLNSLFGTDAFGGGQNLSQRESAQEAAAQMKQLSADVKGLEAALKSTLKVEVTNQPGPGAPVVSEAGRTGSGG